MKDLSITQEYLLCALSQRGTLPIIGMEVQTCVLAGGLIELLVGGYAQMGDKITVQAADDSSAQRAYLKTLVEYLRESGPVKIEKVARDYCLSLTEKRMHALVTDIGNSLAGRGSVTIEKGGILAGMPRFVPNPAEVDKVIQKIRAELLESGTMADETVALVSLLEKSHLIKKYFSSYEAKQLKTRLKEIREAPSNQLVKQMVDYIDEMLAVIVVIAAAH